MGEKAEKKREYILEQARKIFAEKGFKNVTMKDIVAACNISRGGVYLYFNDTKEIFEAVLQQMAKRTRPYFKAVGFRLLSQRADEAIFKYAKE